MNRVHRVEFSERFWTRVLGSYALAAYNQCQFFAQDNFSFPVPFEAINGWSPAGRKHILQNQVLTFLRSLKGKHSLKDIPDRIPTAERIVLGVRAEFSASDLRATPLSFNWILSLGLPDASARWRLDEESMQQETTTNRNICKSVPKLYVEYFAALLCILKSAEALPVKEIYVEHYSSSFEKILAAYLVEKNGACLYQLQTGGFVGETVISIEPFQRSLYDRLLTYGWKVGPQDFPYYAVRLEQFKQNYLSERSTEKKWDVLVVYGNAPNSNAVDRHYTECTESIIEKLDRNRYPRVLFRPRATSKILRIASYPTVFKRVKRREVDRGSDSIARLCARSSIVVHWTMPSTNFLECVFVDHPIVAVDTNQFPTEAFKPFQEFFREVGVFHSSPESLVRFLNETEIQTWWSRVSSNEVYLKFKDQFARSQARYLKSLNDQRADA